MTPHGDADVIWRHQQDAVVTWEMENGEYVVNRERTNLVPVPPQRPRRKENGE
jgi:hypothetical protein